MSEHHDYAQIQFEAIKVMTRKYYAAAWDDEGSTGRAYYGEIGDETQYLTADEIQERIIANPDSVVVRGAWCALDDWGVAGEVADPCEFRIIFFTSGPTVRIVGKLDKYARPTSAIVQYQDSPTTWAVFTRSSEDNLSLLSFCEIFKFSNPQLDTQSRLVSAAPDLLAACEAAMLWAKTPGNHGGNPYMHNFIKLADAAIAKVNA